MLCTKKRLVKYLFQVRVFFIALNQQYKTIQRAKTTNYIWLISRKLYLQKAANYLVETFCEGVCFLPNFSSSYSSYLLILGRAILTLCRHDDA